MNLSLRCPSARLSGRFDSRLDKSLILSMNFILLVIALSFSFSFLIGTDNFCTSLCLLRSTETALQNLFPTLLLWNGIIIRTIIFFWPFVSWITYTLCSTFIIFVCNRSDHELCDSFYWILHFICHRIFISCMIYFLSLLAGAFLILHSYLVFFAFFPQKTCLFLLLSNYHLLVMSNHRLYFCLPLMWTTFLECYHLLACFLVAILCLLR